MTETVPDPIAQAITALTDAARQRRVVGAGTSSEHTEPDDFAEIACHVLTAVAANIGSVDELLAGRSGSWEAALIRQVVEGTAGTDDRDLLAWRTEPVRLALDVEAVFEDFGLYQLYEDAADELNRRVDAAADALWEAVATAEERDRLAALQADIPQLGGPEWDSDRDRVTAMYEEAGKIIKAVEERGAEGRHPLAAALAKARSAAEAVEALWEQDQAAYAEAYKETARRLLAERGLSVGVEVAVNQALDVPEWDELADELENTARSVTLLPMSGTAPDWTDGTPADALRRAGLTYLDRADDQ